MVAIVQRMSVCNIIQQEGTAPFGNVEFETKVCRFVQVCSICKSEYSEVNQSIQKYIRVFRSISEYSEVYQSIQSGTTF